MGFSLLTKVLTPDGYVSISELKVGQKVVTPFGDTKITVVGYMIDPGYRGEVRLDSQVTILTGQNMLANQSIWGEVRNCWRSVQNLEVTQTLLRAGTLVMDKPEERPWGLVSAAEDELVYLGSEEARSRLKFEYSQGTADAQAWILGTENRLAVVGRFVTSANFFPLDTYEGPGFIHPTHVRLALIPGPPTPDDLTLLRRQYPNELG